MRTAFLIVGLSLVLRVGCVAAFPGIPEDDAASYERVAIHFLATGEMGEHGPEMARAPLFPGLVAAVYVLAGRAPQAVGYVQAVLGAVTTWLIIWIGARVGSTRVGHLAGLIHATSIYSIWYVSALMSETLALLLVCGVLALSLVPKREGWAGALLGLSVLTRPAALYLAPGLVLAGRPRWQGALLAAVLCLLVLFPWVYRSHRMGYTWTTLSTSEGSNLWMASGRGATTGSFDWGRLAESAKLGAGSPEGEGRIKSLVIREALAHPVWFAGLCGKRVWILFSPKAEGLYGAHTHTLARTLRTRLRPLVALLQGVAVFWGLFHWRRYRALLLPMLFYVLGVGLTFSVDRLREMLLPFLAVLMAGMIEALYLWLRARVARGAAESERVAAMA